MIALAIVLLLAPSGEPRDDYDDDDLHPDFQHFAPTSSLPESERDIERVLIDRHKPTIQLIVFPSFEPEYAVFLERFAFPGDALAKDIRPYIVVRSLQKQIGLGNEAPAGSMPVTTHSAPVDERTAKLLIETWARFLERMPCGSRGMIQFDGQIHSFGGFNSAGEPVRGWVDVPHPRYRSSQLVGISIVMHRYAQAPEAEREKLAADLRARAEALLARIAEETRVASDAEDCTGAAARR
jgi:hypothetical protein